MIPAYLNTWHGRDDVSPEAARALRAAGFQVEVRRHGPGVNPVRFALGILSEIAESSAPLALRVEDDAIAIPGAALIVESWDALLVPTFGMGLGLTPLEHRGRTFGFLDGPPSGEIGAFQIFRTEALRAVLPEIYHLAAAACDAWDHGIDALAIDTLIPAAFVRLGFTVHVHGDRLAQLNPRAVSGWGGHKGQPNAEVP